MRRATAIALTFQPRCHNKTTPTIHPQLNPMTLKQQLLQEIEQIPEPFLPQILQFIQTLKPQQPQPSVKLKQTWAGAMKNYRDQYTALELQQETVNQWTDECIS